MPVKKKTVKKKTVKKAVKKTVAKRTVRKKAVDNEQAVLDQVMADSKKIDEHIEELKSKTKEIESNQEKKLSFDERLKQYRSMEKKVNDEKVDADPKKGVKQDPKAPQGKELDAKNNAKGITDDKVKEALTKSNKNVKKKDPKERKTIAGRRRWFAEHLEKAGYDFDPAYVETYIQKLSIVFAVFAGLYLGITAIFRENTIPLALGKLAIGGLLGYFIAMIASNLMFRIFIDVKKFKRKLMIEDVLPDFFQLASANIRAGMPIDKALWFAVRPRFGVLAKEIEIVAKKTLSGGNLQESLIEFANKYDSVLVLRSFNLLNEGIQAGGNIGDLLNKIANNVQEIKSLKKEMAANVTTYVIFIGFAAVVAGPLLFGLSGQLLAVVQGISQNVGSSQMPDTSQSSGIGIQMELGGENTIELEDYRIFVFTCITLSSLFSAMIVSIIKKGNVKEGLQYIPIFTIISFILFYVSDYIMGIMLSGMIPA